ncbi:AAA family ATPase, partial [Mycoplasmopsis synoviae]
VSYGMDPKEAEEIAKKYIKLVGLSEEYLKRSPFDLSRGQKRRVALDGILAMEPDVLVVDEPTAGLDPWGVKEILDILTHLHESGKTIINVTHDLDHVLERAKRV